MGKPIVTLGNSNLMNTLINTQPASTVKEMKHTANAVIIHAVKDYYDNSMLVLNVQRFQCFDAVHKQEQVSKANCFDTYGAGLISNSTNMHSLSDTYKQCIEAANSIHTTNIKACNTDFATATDTLVDDMKAVTGDHLFNTDEN